MFGRAGAYGPTASKDSFIAFYTTQSGVDELALTIDENQDCIFSGRVGVGTSNPSFPTHIIGNNGEPGASPSGNGTLFIGDNQTANSGGVLVGYHNGASGYGWLQSYGGLPLQLNPVGNNIILNRDSGNVGIGTASPTAALTVNDDILLEGHSFTMGDNAADTPSVMDFLGSSADGSITYDPSADVFTFDSGTFIDQDSDAIGLEIDSEATTAANYGLTVVTGAGAITAYFAHGEAANGECYLGLPPNDGAVGSFGFNRNLAAASTDCPVMFILQEHGEDDQAVLVLKQDGTGAALIAGDGTNDVKISSAGHLSLHGTATVFDELPPFPIIGAKLGSTAPTLTTFVTDIEQYTFDATNDYVIGATEITHKWKEGTVLVPHIHWATNGSEGTAQGVKWQLKWSVGDAAEAFSAQVTSVVDVTIDADTPDRTHYMSDFDTTLDGTNLKINAYICWRLERIPTAHGNGEPAANPFGIAVGFHAEMNTMGSRTITDK